jgi:hypothetical protein
MIRHYVFAHVHQYCQEKGFFLSVNQHAECQVQWCLEKEVDLTEMVQWSPCTNTQIFTCPNDLCMRAWRTLHTEGLYLYHIQLLHFLKLCTWVCGYNHTIELMQTPKWFVKFCLMMICCNHTGVNSNRNYHLQDHHISNWRIIRISTSTTVP